MIPYIFANLMSYRDQIHLYKTIILIFIIFFTSCESNKHIRTYRIPKPDKMFNIENAEKDESDERNEFNIGWEKPGKWKEVTGHSMRLASFLAPFSKGEGDVSVTTFVGHNGGIGPNVNRWLGQIALESISEAEIKKMAIDKTGNLGQYLYFKLINAKDNSSAILASIYQLDQRTVFIKLSSSVLGIMELEQDFQKFCSSIYKK